MTARQYLIKNEPVRMSLPVLASAWRATGLPGKPPPVYMAKGKSLIPGAAGWQPLQNRKVFLNPETAKGLRTLPFASGRNRAALSTLLHEYAHVAQPRVFPRNRIEPGADLFSLNTQAKVERALHIPAKDSEFGLGQDFQGKDAYLGYPQLVAKLTQSPEWKRFILRSQFGKPVGGVPRMRTI